MDAIQSNSVLQGRSLNTLLSQALASRTAAASATGTSTPTPTPGSTGTSSATDFEAMMYQSQMQRTSLALQYSQAAAQANADGSAGTAANQIEFQFASESKSEQLAMFSQSTSTTADGLSQAQRTQFLAVSRSLSMRFKLSVKMSGEALQSFSSAAKTLKSTGDASLDKFFNLMKKIFGKDDDTLKDLLKFLDHMLNGLGGSGQKMDKLLDDLSQLGQSKKGGDAAGEQVQEFQLDFEFEFSFESNQVQVQQATVQQCDPLVLDLDDDGIELTDHTQGAQFDIAGSGAAVQTAFVNGGDAFLALDRNGNGRIDNGGELFGDQHGAANGYEELRRFDTNADGVINAEDKDFDKLMLFRDNGDGISEAGELMSLADAGISEIDLNYRHTNAMASGGNRLAQMATYRRHDGSSGNAADALLNFVA